MTATGTPGRSLRTGTTDLANLSMVRPIQGMDGLSNGHTEPGPEVTVSM